VQKAVALAAVRALPTSEEARLRAYVRLHLVRLGIVSLSREQPAPHELSNSSRAGRESVLESKVVDRLKFFRSQHNLETLDSFVV
jgi:hypothetical protein